MSGGPQQGNGGEAADAAICDAIAGHLARIGGRVVQIASTPGADWAAELPAALWPHARQRLVLIVAASTDLPAVLSQFATVRSSAAPHSFGPADLAVALDRLPLPEHALVLVLTAPGAPPLPPRIAAQAAVGAGQLAALLREGACGDGVAG